MYFRNYFPLKKDPALHLNKLEFSSSKNALCQVRFKLALMFWRRRFFVNVFSLFRNYLPFEKGWVLHFNIFEFFQPCMDALCQILLKLAKWFWGRRFLHFINVFYYFVIIPPWKTAQYFMSTNLNPLLTNMLCLKLAKWFWRSEKFTDRRGLKPIRKAHLSFQLR